MKKKGFIVLSLIFGTFAILTLSLKKCSEPVFIPQPNFGQLGSPFEFTDYRGDTISSCSLNDNIVLYNFLSVDCPNDFEKCPFRLEWFKIKIYTELVGNLGFKDVKVVTSFIDTISDINDRISEFRKYNEIDSDKWIMTSNSYFPYFDQDFLRGNPWEKKDTLFGFEREAYLMTLLVDKNQQIRGKYFTYNFGEIRRITKEISLLIREEIQNDSTYSMPVLGNKDFDPSIPGDTAYHEIPFWSFINQKGDTVTGKIMSNKVCLVDFFFTHCPTICPIMTSNMKKIQSKLENECIDDVELISYTVDPDRDSVERLREYANSYDVNFDNWNLLTGDQKTIYELGVNGYLVPNQEDALAPGGFLHSEKMILIDQQQRIRGYYDGTDEENISKIVKDIKKLL